MSNRDDGLAVGHALGESREPGLSVGRGAHGDPGDFDHRTSDCVPLAE
ncbi:MAG TPA: hypothetical protein PLJ78_11480 [Anaerolineae bacterium]|nr:hypothetical protein [Anaerolineae bacterium]HQK14550.1 hypothetical protein [Anaerolineae bacterium]